MPESSPQGKVERVPGLENLIKAAHSSDPVQGLTHEFYRYPARFSPQFVRAVIETFTLVGDAVLDPFMGGGTTLVESLALGRRAAGCDLNSLAVFLARAKTTILSQPQIEQLAAWACDTINAELEERTVRRETNDPRFRNVPWWISSRIQSILARVKLLGVERLGRAARCALLKTSQWALDCRERIPSGVDFLRRFEVSIADVCKGYQDLRVAVGELARRPSTPRALHRSVIGLENDRRIPSAWKPINLVVTSPPYPGVHVLYHRWQVRGRRETPLAYGICDTNDGQGTSYYTLGGRHHRTLDRYFDLLKQAFTSVRKLVAPDSWIVQMVAFSEPSWQVKKYLSVMEEAGYRESDLSEQVGKARVWRDVPSRKWYIRIGRDLPAGKELVLIHRPN